ncbi:MAG: protein kinase, partial [Opitutales bacterium]|nr:protein kinase [Opitutales bacterium]
YLDNLKKIYNKLEEDLDSQTPTGWLKNTQRLSSEILNLLNHPPRPVASIAIAMAPDQNQAPEEEAYGADDHQNQTPEGGAYGEDDHQEQAFADEDGNEMTSNQNQDQAPEGGAYGADDSQNQGFEYQPPFIGFPGGDFPEESTSPVLSSANDSQMSIALGPVPQSSFMSNEEFTLDEELAGKWEYEVNFSDISALSNPEYLGQGGFGTTYRMLLPNGEFCVVKLFKEKENEKEEEEEEEDKKKDEKEAQKAFIHEFTVNMVLKAQAMNIINSLRTGDFSEQNIFLFECLYHLVACYSKLEVQLKKSRLQIPLTATPEEIKSFLEENIDEFKCTIGDEHGYALIFEYVEGTTLLNAAQSNPTMSFEVLQMRINLLGQLCRALAFLDHAGIAHMDFKNDNIMITNQNTIKLLDLGLAFLRTNMILFDNPLLGLTFYSMTPEMLVAIAGATMVRDEARALAGVMDEEEEIEINSEIFQVMENNFDKINIFPLWRIAFSILFWENGFWKVDFEMVNQMKLSNWDINTAVALDKEFRPNIAQNLNELNTTRNRTWDWNPPFLHTQTYFIFDPDTLNNLVELLVRISVDNPEERMSAVEAFAFIQDEILPNMISYQIPEENKEEEAKDAA